MRKALNRERSHVGRTAYTPRIKTILLSCKSNKVAQLMTDDLKNHANGLMHDELKWIEISSHAVRILSSVSKSVLFMTAEQLISGKNMVDEAQNKKEQIVVVPNKVAERISHLSDLSGEPVRDLSQYIKVSVKRTHL
ncbi:MAG: hypothetical protein WB791_02265 [Waddliaceae bacterium]